MKIYDVIIIGGGQSALACAYFLNRTGLDFLILDEQPEGGGAWQHGWDSLTLFSPSDFSSLPGWMMPKSEGKFPSRDEVIKYLKAYQARYDIDIKRQSTVIGLRKLEDLFEVETDTEVFQAKVVVSATGTWRHPFIPAVEGK